MTSYAFFMAVSALSLVAAYRHVSSEVRVPLLAYCILYSITTVVGATIIGASGGESVLWRLTNAGLNSGALSGTYTFTYWLVLYSPLIVIPIVLFFLDKLPLFDRSIERVGSALELPSLDILTFLTVFCFFSVYCLASLADGGYLANIASSSRLKGDFRSIIQLRVAMAETLSPNFYGVMYGTMPFLSNIALYMAVTRKTRSWVLVFGLTFCMIAFLNLSIMLKGVLLVYVLSLSIGAALLTRTRTYVLVTGCLLAFAGLTTMQFFMQDTIDFAQNFSQVFFRMANSFPYYLDLYPNVFPYMGTNSGLSLVGIEINYDDVTKVIDVMYPDISWIQPQAAAAAHIRGYAQGGTTATLLLEVVIAFLILALSRLTMAMKGPVMFAFYIQGLVMIYYTTQASLGAALFQSYGIKWAVVGLLALVFWYRLSHGAIHGYPQENSRT